MKEPSLKDIEGTLRAAFDVAEQLDNEEALCKALKWILFEKENILKQLVKELPIPVTHRKALDRTFAHCYLKGNDEDENNISVLYYGFINKESDSYIYYDKELFHSLYESAKLPEDIYIRIELLDEAESVRANSWEEFNQICSTYFKRNNYILIP